MGTGGKVTLHLDVPRPNSAQVGYCRNCTSNVQEQYWVGRSTHWMAVSRWKTSAGHLWL